MTKQFIAFIWAMISFTMDMYSINSRDLHGTVDYATTQ